MDKIIYDLINTYNGEELAYDCPILIFNNNQTLNEKYDYIINRLDYIVEYIKKYSLIIADDNEDDLFNKVQNIHKKIIFCSSKKQTQNIINEYINVVPQNIYIFDSNNMTELMKTIKQNNNFKNIHFYVSE